MAGIFIFVTRVRHECPEWPGPRDDSDAPNGHRGAVSRHEPPFRRGTRRSTRALLDGLAIERPKYVWFSDLTYLLMAHGFLCLGAILGVAIRKVLSFRFSNTMTPDFCVDALTEAIARYVAPEFVYTDQGSQLTSIAWTDVLDAAGLRISMDDKGRWIDNVFIERLWRSVKYEDICQRAHENRRELQAGVTRNLEFRNGRRIHQSHEYQTSDEMYYATSANEPLAIAA